MKSLKSLIAILFILCPLSVFSQTVSGTFFNLPQQKVYLNAYTGLYMEVLDSVMMSYDKRVEFNTVLKKGMYQIETEYGYVWDFLYDGSPVKMVVRDVDDEAVGFIGSKINTDWNAYKIYKKRTMKSLSELRPLDNEHAVKEYNDLQNLFWSFTDSLSLDDNYSSVLIRVDRFPAFNPALDYDKQRKEIIASFFDEVDFKDLSLIPTDVLNNKILDFLSLQISPEQDVKQMMMSLILGADNVLYRASVDFEMYKFVFQFLMETFKLMNLDEVVDYMTRIPYSEELKCDKNQYDELLTIAEFNSRVRIGSKAENISGTTIFDEEFDLYEIESEYVIVYFWSYTCDHCKDNIKRFKSFFEQNPEISMVAISVKGDVKKIRSLVKRYKVNSYFYYDGLEWNSPHVNDYAVTATPSFYVLDKNKNIIYKPFDFEELVQFVNIIKR